MKYIIMLLIATMAILNTDAYVSDSLLNALIQVESKGNDTAVGDNGKAVGCLQIHPCVITDVNKHYGTSYKLKDRYDRKKSKEICKKYINYYATKKRLGRKPTNIDKARIWNGGPCGHKLAKTKSYGEKVKKHL